MRVPGVTVLAATILVLTGLVLTGLVLTGLVLTAVVLTAAPSLAGVWWAARRRRRFLPSLGPVVRIATPCRLVHGRVLVPGTLGLTPFALVWDAPFGLAGSTPLESVKRLETDQRLGSGRRFLRSEVLRVTLPSGVGLEFVVSRGRAFEWRRALGEWVAATRLQEDRLG